MSPATVAPSELSKQNPWPGLRAFGENDVDFFFGRDREAAELFSLVQRSPVVVLYGQSGLGKTSLLQAGLFPRLKALDYFPVRVRFDHGDDAPPLARQITAAVAEELDHLQIKGPRPKPNDTLWEYFHRRDVDFWGPRNHLLTPVVVLDQFEEIFTLGHRSEKSNARVAEFQKELESQLEHRPPDSVRERLEANPDEALQYDLKRQGVKFVITLREDFLPDLDPWRERMPSLLPNRFRLERMTGQQALEVVQRAGSDVVDPSVARDIVDFVSTSRLKRSSSALEQRDVDPALLSVVCDGLNYSRISRGKSRITADLLTAEREEIMKDFYERTFEGVDPRVRDWVEDRLLTSSGYRDRAALDDAKKLGLPESDFDVLVNRRLLHREERAGVIWLELTHDSLTDPASRSRAVREQRIQAEAAKEREKAAAEREAQVRSQLRRSRVTIAIGGVLLVIAILALVGVYSSYKARIESDKKADIAAKAALQSNQNESKMAELMGSNIEDPRILTQTAVKNIHEDEQSYLNMAHPGASGAMQHAQFLTNAAEAYFRFGYIKEGTEEAKQAVDLLEKTNGPDVPADQLSVAHSQALYSYGRGLLVTGHLAEARRCFEDAIKLASAPNAPALKSAAQRVNILSRIDLGRADEEGWAFPSAQAHIREALDIIKANPSNADEVLSWNAVALEAMGQSQNDDSAALANYAEAAKLIKELMARNSEDLYRRRQFAHITYLQGIAALNLDRFDEAKQLLEQSLSTSEDLCNRDNSNLDWRLGLVQSQRGIALLYENDGEWDRAQPALKAAQTEVAELTLAQPAWIRVLHEAGAVEFTLGDVLRAKYSDETDPDEKAHLLEEVSSLYNRARDWSEKGSQVTPESMEFVRLGALSIGREGFVLGNEGRALDTTIKGNQEKKNKKETEALKLYKEAFEKMGPVVRVAGNESKTLTDETYLHFWVGNAWVQLAKTNDAVAAYKEAVITTRDLVKKSKVAENYELHSQAFGFLADTYASNNQLDDAVTNYRLAEDAVREALRLKPFKTGFHVQEARIQGQLFEICFKRNDFVAAVNSLELGVNSSLAALKNDYADPTLNQDVKYFADRLEKTSTALQAKPAAGTPTTAQVRVSPEQIKALLQKIKVLSGNIAPQELLDHYKGNVSWTLHPLMPGGWRELASEERVPALTSLLALTKNLKQDQVFQIRALPLGFYDNVVLYEAEVELENGRHGVAAFVKHGTKTLLVEGASTTAHTLNRESQLKLDNVTRATEYVRFFIGALQAEDGRFKLIDTPDDFNWLAESTAEQRAGVLAAIKPLTVEKSSDMGWQAIGTVLYNSYLTNVSIHLSRFGEIEFETERTPGDRLPLYVEVFENGIRVQQTLAVHDKKVQEGKLAKAEDTARKNPNDAKTLSGLPGQYSKLKRWPDAVQAEKNWIAFLQRQTTRDNNWPTTVSNADILLAWYQLNARDFAGALASSEAAEKLVPSNLGAELTRAHALLFLGRSKGAEAIYLKNVGKKVTASSKQYWEQDVVGDFNDLESEKVTDPETARVRDLMTRANHERLRAQYEQQLNTNPNDETALRQLPSVYYNLGRSKDAVEEEKKRIAILQRQTNHDKNWSKTMSEAYGSLSWYQLFTRDFAGALASGQEAHKLDPANVFSETNRAHALLFLGRIQEAEEIYFQHRGEKVFADSDEKWEQAVLNDFDDLEKAGITSPEFVRLRVDLKPPAKTADSH